LIRRGEIDYLCIRSAEIIPRVYDAILKMVIFGEPEVVKSKLTQRFLTKLFTSDSKMTIGVDFEVKSVEIDGKRVKLQIWDFEGQERFKFLLSTYARGARGGLFVYDVNKESSLTSIDEWLTIIRKEINAEERFPIIIVGIINVIRNNTNNNYWKSFLCVDFFSNNR